MQEKTKKRGVSCIKYLVSGMVNEKAKIKNFTDLEVWKEEHKLVLLVYKIVNKEFHGEERFGL